MAPFALPIVPMPPGAVSVTFWPDTNGAAPARIAEPAPLVVIVVEPSALLIDPLTRTLAFDAMLTLLVAPPLKLMPIA